MSTVKYRLYCLDGSGRLHEAEWLWAASDADAIALVEEKYPGGTCEIWEERRLVAKLSPRRRSA